MQNSYGTIIPVGLGTTKIIADIDFETYSPAGYDFKEGQYVKLSHAPDKGLPLVGAARYTEHPDAEVLCMAYNLKNGSGAKLWTPQDKLPVDLFNYIRNGGILEAWNAEFECLIWNKICVKKYGFPPLISNNFRCAAAKSRAFSLPGKLEKAGEVLNITNKKDKIGKRLINKFSIPQNITKKNKSLRIYPQEDFEGMLLYDYCLRDIEAEAELSSQIPDLNFVETQYWHINHVINWRGVAVDLNMIECCISIIEQSYEKYTKELQKITNNEVNTVFETKNMINWLCKQGVNTNTVNAEKVKLLLQDKDLNDKIRKVLEIRQLLSSASVKKLYAMRYQICDDGRLHNLFIYHSAHTGRAAGTGCQPHNFPKGKLDEDNIKIAFDVIATRDLNIVENKFENAINTVSSCLRGLFIAKPKYRLISSDYSSIEAIVLAALAGEEWRLEVFRTHGRIYEMTASSISGIPFGEFLNHKHTTGSYHPLRNTLGKIAELASGFGGWIGAWKNAGADKFFDNEEDIKRAIVAWRATNKNIVEFWGGQTRNYRKEYYGIEGAAISAMLSPGEKYEYRGISFLVRNQVLYCTLLSGRHMAYQNPKLYDSEKRPGTLALSYEGWNSNIKNGKKGWMRMNTYGGKLVENIVQATARDILMNAIKNLEERGYPVVLHVHDEIVSEVINTYGTIEEFESIMNIMPDWAKDWSIKAKGGWEGMRYKK